MNNEENGWGNSDADHVEELGELGVGLVDLGVHDVGVLGEDALDQSFQVVVCCSEDLVDGVWLVEEQHVDVVVVALEVVQHVV